MRLYGQVMGLRATHPKLGSQWSIHNHHFVYHRKHLRRTRTFYPQETEIQNNSATTWGFHSL